MTGQASHAHAIETLPRLRRQPVEVRRFQWGCGGSAAPGWVNSDLKEEDPGIDVTCDGRALAIRSGVFDYAVSVHALQEIALPELVPVLTELRRVLRPGGVLRLVVPDVDLGIAAYMRGNASHFVVPDEDVRSLGGKFVTHILWYGWSRSMFTADFLEELLESAGYVDVTCCAFQQTASPWPEILELDCREDESLFMEGTSPG